MTDGSADDELERLREKRRRELIEARTSPGAPAEPADLPASEVDGFVDEHDLALIDLWAPWCGPCKVVGPILDDLAGDVDDLAVGKVNVDENQGVAERFGAQGIPTLLVFRDGELVDRHVGAARRPQLESLVERNRPP
jgi:thioredoxin 1